MSFFRTWFNIVISYTKSHEENAKFTKIFSCFTNIGLIRDAFGINIFSVTQSNNEYGEFVIIYFVYDTITANTNSPRVSTA